MPFKKGQSGNPSGRPKVDVEIRALAQQHTPAAVAALAEIVSDKNAQPGARVRAAEVIIERGYGRAPQTVTINADDELLKALDGFGNDALRSLAAALAGTAAAISAEDRTNSIN